MTLRTVLLIILAVALSPLALGAKSSLNLPAHPYVDLVAPTSIQPAVTFHQFGIVTRMYDPEMHMVCYILNKGSAYASIACVHGQP